MDNDLREALAAYAHKAWCGWMGYMFSKCERDAHGHVIIPDWAVKRWMRQMMTKYADLPDDEKKSDRTEADEMLAIVEQHRATDPERQAKERQPMSDEGKTADPMDPDRAKLILGQAISKSPIVYTVRRFAGLLGWDRETEFMVLAAMLVEQNNQLLAEAVAFRTRNTRWMFDDLAPWSRIVADNTNDTRWEENRK